MSAHDKLRDLFEELVGVPSPSRRERAVADLVLSRLRQWGLTVTEDDAGPRAGLAAGNLLARVPGGDGVPVLLCAHLDTVPIEGAPTVVEEGGVLRGGDGAMGADDKVAVAALMLLARDLAATAPPAPVEFLFTTGEEIGLRGAFGLDAARLEARAGFVFDGEGPVGTVVTAAPTLDAVTAEFTGQAAHAGIEPEQGRSAVGAAARAVAAMRLGRLDDHTTANIGVIHGGTATNVVPERCVLRGEARGHAPEALVHQVADMVHVCQTAAAECGVDVQVDVRREFDGFALSPDDLCVRLATAAIRECALSPRLVVTGGGSDANVLNARGLPTVPLGVGFEHAHSSRERVAVAALGQVFDLARGIVAAARREADPAVAGASGDGAPTA